MSEALFLSLLQGLLSGALIGAGWLALRHGHILTAIALAVLGGLGAFSVISKILGGPL